ncbi:Uncharacterized protein FWK35_00010649 [Aphis craccivora]|uniref:Uncharacterized protein n=1 Tax=Aphis craccivora TaxID=307492 RepID=A0A6G0ZDP7_APHCR|nr:Uncharacterized protein FWK35_00010649 [Aphis craccivora]
MFARRFCGPAEALRNDQETRERWARIKKIIMDGRSRTGDGGRSVVETRWDFVVVVSTSPPAVPRARVRAITRAWYVDGGGKPVAHLRDARRPAAMRRRCALVGFSPVFFLVCWALFQCCAFFKRRDPFNGEDAPGVGRKVYKKIFFLRNAQIKTIVVKGIDGDGPKHGCVYEYHYNIRYMLYARIIRKRQFDRTGQWKRSVRARALETNSRTFDDALRNARRSAEYHLHVRIGKKKNREIREFPRRPVFGGGTPNDDAERWRRCRGGSVRTVGRVGGERTAAVSRGTGRAGRESSSSAPSHPLEAPRTARTRVHANRGTPPPPPPPPPTPPVAIFAGARHPSPTQTQGPRRPAYAVARDDGEERPREPASKRRCQFGRTAGATFLRARPIPPGRFVFWRRALYGTSAVYASAHSHSISRPAKSSEAG